MNGTITQIAAIAGVVAAAGFGLMALAQPGPGHGPQARGMEHLHRMLMHMADELELTDAQRDQIHDVVKGSGVDAHVEQMEALRASKQRLGSVIHDPDATDQQVIDASRAVAEVEERLALERHRMFVAINGVLTPEQQERVKELHAERRGGPGEFAPKHRRFHHGR
jgi:Spy/CpxP family protein refolding chaperone